MWSQWGSRGRGRRGLQIEKGEAKFQKLQILKQYVVCNVATFIYMYEGCSLRLARNRWPVEGRSSCEYETCCPFWGGRQADEAEELGIR